MAASGEEKATQDEKQNEIRIATISSPSTTTSLSLEILEDAATKKLIGELICFEFDQDGSRHHVLGQITEVELKNFMLEFSEIRSLARQRGSVNPISGTQDTHQGHMTTGAVFKERDDGGYEPSILGSVPSTGTIVRQADDGLLSRLLSQYTDRIFYLGRFYESELKLPMWFHHFGKPKDGGAGEAYHIGIYGMTGSGKSTLAKMILCGYARHPGMAIFIFDPSGEFTKSAEGKTGSEQFGLDLKSVLDSLGKKIITKSVGEIVLDRWDLFEELLYESDFFQSLTIPRRENRETACRIMREKLEGNIKLEQLSTEESFNQAIGFLRDAQIQEQIYPSPGARKRFNDNVDNHPADLYDRHWKPLANLFNSEGKTKIGRLVDQTFDVSGERPVIIINLAPEQIPKEMIWNNEIKAIFINRIVSELKRQGAKKYQNSDFLNTLVILDEAQRLVPREKFGEERKDKLRASLLDAVQTTRKYGLGWMFISLSLSTLHREIYHENRISFYGFGLSSGTELASLKELIADQNSIKLYQTFKDPHSVIDTDLRTYSFMTRGPVSPLSFSGTPLLLTTFQSSDGFLKENDIREAIRN